MTECFERPCETGIDLLGTSAVIREDLRRFSARLGDLRVLLGVLLVAVLVITLTMAWGGRASNATRLSGAGSRALSAVSLSGDDLYDPAAGSHPMLFARAAAASYSGDDAYDPAAGGTPE
jgi:hypothetical protein